MKWRQHPDFDLSQENIGLLLNNEIPYIRESNFILPEEVKTLIKELNSIGFEYYENVEPPIGKIGVTVFENQNDPAHYFKGALSSTSKLQRESEGHHNAMVRLIRTIGEKSRIRSAIAYDNTRDQLYFAGLVRLMKGGALLHIDYAPFDCKEYVVSKSINQLACNIFLQTPEGGGDVTVFNCPWTEPDENLKISGSYGYHPSVVEHKDSVTIQPKVGDLILFNSRNFHKVAPNRNLDDNRITISCFAGFFNGQLHFWS